MCSSLDSSANGANIPDFCHRVYVFIDFVDAALRNQEKRTSRDHHSIWTSWEVWHVATYPHTHLVEYRPSCADWLTKGYIFGCLPGPGQPRLHYWPMYLLLEQSIWVYDLELQAKKKVRAKKLNVEAGLRKEALTGSVVASKIVVASRALIRNLLYKTVSGPSHQAI